MDNFVTHLVEIYYKTKADDTDVEIKEVLEGANIPYQLEVVENPDEFREKTSQANPEIILLDASLPRQDIMDAIDFAGNNSGKASVFIIVKTLNQVAEAMSLEGITGFLIKGRIKQLIPFLSKIASERAEKMRVEAERDTLSKYFNIANVLFLVFDVEGRVVRMNKFVSDITGYKPEEVVGRNWIEEFIPEDNRDKVRNVLTQLNTSHIDPVKYNINEIITKHGTRKTIAWSNSILYDFRGKIKNIIAIGSDITEKRKYEAAMDAYTRFNVRETGKDFFEALVLYINRAMNADATLISSFEGEFKDECRTLAVAEGGKLLPNFTYRATVGAGAYAHNVPVENDHEELIERFKGVEHVGIDLSGSAGQKLGELVFISRSPIENPGLIKLVLQLFSVRTGAELEHVIKTAEINALNGVLRERAKELLRVTEDLQELSYVVSHDFNEPLRAISGFIQTFKEKFAVYGDDEMNRHLDLIQNTSERTRRVLRGILEYSRVSKGNAFEVAQFNYVVHKAKQQLSRQLLQLGALLKTESLPVAVADEEQMITVFNHLIDNALKFRHPGRQPVIHIYAEKDHNNWVFYVKDNGLGFNNIHAEKIFRMFTKLDSNNSLPGAGLGLAICRKIIERHGGKIAATSEPGIGTTINFTLPI